jgi:hypothetical protein
MTHPSPDEAKLEVLGGVSEHSEDIPLFSSRPQAGFPAPGDDQIERVLDKLAFSQVMCSWWIVHLHRVMASS